MCDNLGSRFLQSFSSTSLNINRFGEPGHSFVSSWHKRKTKHLVPRTLPTIDRAGAARHRARDYNTRGADAGGKGRSEGGREGGRARRENATRPGRAGQHRAAAPAPTQETAGAAEPLRRRGAHPASRGPRLDPRPGAVGQRPQRRGGAGRRGEARRTVAASRPPEEKGRVGRPTRNREAAAGVRARRHRPGLDGPGRARGREGAQTPPGTEGRGRADGGERQRRGALRTPGRAREGCGGEARRRAARGAPTFLSRTHARTAGASAARPGPTLTGGVGSSSSATGGKANGEGARSPAALCRPFSGPRRLRPENEALSSPPAEKGFPTEKCEGSSGKNLGRCEGKKWSSGCHGGAAGRGEGLRRWERRRLGMAVGPGSSIQMLVVLAPWKADKLPGFGMLDMDLSQACMNLAKATILEINLITCVKQIDHFHRISGTENILQSFNRP